MATKKVIVPLSIAAITMLCVAPDARSGPKDRYAVVTLVNETPYRVDYSYIWGGNGNTNRNNYIKPKSRYVHWWKFKYQGQDYAPWFYVEPEGRSTPYKLRSFYSPNTEGDNGRIYYIRFENSKFVIYGKLYTN